MFKNPIYLVEIGMYISASPFKRVLSIPAWWSRHLQNI